MSKIEKEWLRKRYCIRCGNLFATYGKFTKICDKCDRRWKNEK